MSLLEECEQRAVLHPLRCGLLIILIAAAALPARAMELTGTATPLDGDTLALNGEHVRLHGIDAPERTQTCSVHGQPWACGRGAQQYLAAATGGRTVVCQGSKRDRYGRLIAVCSVDGRNLNADLVRQGWAIAYRRYALDYVGEEAEAQQARRGLWQGEFVPPADWRQGVRALASGE
jgi:endonuclease YncB( thermonuclease family)